MALYRTERRLSWHRSLTIGYWTAPWSGGGADTGSDYFSRALGWLQAQHPKAELAVQTAALPAPEAEWPQGRFGEGAEHTRLAPAADSAANGKSAEAPAHSDAAAAATPHLLLVEWPQATLADATKGGAARTTTAEGSNAAHTDAAQGGNAAKKDSAPSKASVSRWANGLERALRRAWQQNPETEVVLIGGPAGIEPPGVALAKHYGFAVLDVAALIRASAKDGEAMLAQLTVTAPENPSPSSSVPAGSNTAPPPANGNAEQDDATADAGDTANAFPASKDKEDSNTPHSNDGALAGSGRQSCGQENNGRRQNNTDARLTPQGQELWAGALIAFLREHVRFGPTPEPVSLPEGLWGK